MFITQNIRYLILIMLCVLLAYNGFAQDSMPATFTTGKKLYEEKKYEEAVAILYKTLWELNKQPSKNSTFYSNERTVLNYIDSSYLAAEKDNIPFTNLDFDTTETETRLFGISKVVYLDS